MTITQSHDPSREAPEPSSPRKREGAGRPSSRIPGLHRRTLEERREVIGERLGSELRRFLVSGDSLPLHVADRMSENVVTVQGLPLSVATNFRVDGRDVLVPMSVEEPSVVAAASNAARMVRLAGGFEGEADESVMTAQVQLDAVADAERAPERVAAAREQLIATANAAIPRMVARGGGCRDVETRVLDGATGLVVLHFYVDVGDAMGANVVDTVAEAVAPHVLELLGGEMGLRILSNLPMRRRVRVRCRVHGDDLGGLDLARRIERASVFAEKDPYRAVTHNKGIMNGIDAVAVALGQDWRSIEAGAHAFAALGGGYGPLATWRLAGDHLEGKLELPLAVATVGGSTQVHPGVRLAFGILGVERARELALVMASVGLASNLAALCALAGEGIQQGHMRLHARKAAPRGEGSRS